MFLAAVVIGAVAFEFRPPAAHDALAMRATVFGHMPPPAGTALVSETYTPARMTIDGPRCAMYERVFATNDPPAFARAVYRTALDSRRVTVIRLDADHPEINTLEGIYGATGSLEGEGASASLAFFDLDAGWRRFFEHQIDTSAWRWAAWILVGDKC
jgi:hypothetical protein